MTRPSHALPRVCVQQNLSIPNTLPQSLFQLLAALVFSLALAWPGISRAQAAGDWMLTLGATHVSPNVNSDSLSQPVPNSKVDLSDSTRAVLGITGMLTDNLSLTLPLTDRFRFDIRGDGGIRSLGKIGETDAQPITLLAQYRFGEPNSGIRPYLGVGAVYTRFQNEHLNPIAGQNIGLSLEDQTSPAAQVGLSFQFDEHWFMDANYMHAWIKTKASLSTGQHMDVRIDPDFYSLGVGYRF